MARTPVLLLSLAVFASTLTAASVRAGDQGYRWSGPRVGCPGEVQMIRAIENLDRVLAARSHQEFDYWMEQVDREIHAALQSTGRLTTRRHLQQALQGIHRAKQTHDRRDLDLVYRELIEALRHEQQNFRCGSVRYPVPRPYYKPAPRYHRPHHGGSHYRRPHHGGSQYRRPHHGGSPHRRPHGSSVRSQSRRGISIQGRRGGIRIGF